MQQASRNKGPRDCVQPEEVATYVVLLARELKTLVDCHNLITLGYLLDLARVEAEESAWSKSDKVA